MVLLVLRFRNIRLVMDRGFLPPKNITVEAKGKKKSVNDRSDWRKI